MGEFKAITTQEEFDAAIKDRIARAEQTTETRVRQELKDDLDKMKALETSVQSLTAERDGFKTKAEENAAEITKLQGLNDENAKKLKAYETDAMKLKIAQEVGIPISQRGRLSGETEEEIRKDAENFAKVFKAANNQGLPAFEHNDGIKDGAKKQEFKTMLGKLRKGE